MKTKTKKAGEEKTEESAEKLNKEEIEAKIIELAKQGVTSEKIGLILKEKYNVLAMKIHGKKISKILKENNLYKNPDILNLEKKAEKLKKHIEKNKHDYKTKRTLLIKQAKLKKLKK